MRRKERLLVGRPCTPPKKGVEHLGVLMRRRYSGEVPEGLRIWVRSRCVERTVSGRLHECTNAAQSGSVRVGIGT